MVFATKVRITNAIRECIYHIFIYLSLKLENKNKILWYRMVWSPSSVSCVCLLPSNMAEATQASPMMSIPTSTSRIAASYTRDQIPWNNSKLHHLWLLKDLLPVTQILQNLFSFPKEVIYFPWFERKKILVHTRFCCWDLKN